MHIICSYYLQFILNAKMKQNISLLMGYIKNLQPFTKSLGHKFKRSVE